MKLVQRVVEIASVSRRAATELIKTGQVKVNGQVSYAYSLKVDTQTDTIEVTGAGEASPAPTRKYYFAYHKPKGIECTLAQKNNSLLPVVQKIEAPNLKPVGRLDLDSEGLLILTNDGALIYQLTHPKHNLLKTYNVWVNGLQQPQQIKALRKNLPLVEVKEKEDDKALLEVKLQEGQNRQIRRSCLAVGLYVERILRTAIGTVQLGKLKAGEWKILNNHEHAQHASLGESFFSQNR
jgi:pseudouridine synthase